ncbi:MULTISPECIES: hypothetical protein [unclassified Streptomyces]|uniref:hypothetical protein n=1 Tax=unclassified Streptomyces TaxID=2593676 RepID=UPI0021C9A376|nr:hypothetical protein [Streptomyces sp. FIT100]UUN26069.1 hypothetical protein KK483_06235 [Streptomyces sp. FIT100]
MKRSGPLITLAAGLVLGLFMLALNSMTGKPVPTSADRTPSPSPSPRTPAPPPPPAASPSPTAPPNAAAQTEFAGRTTDNTASVAISLRGDKAIAYFCDGRTREAWMRGPVEDDGDMHLTSSESGAKLDAVLTGGKATGTVEIGDRNWPFSADKAVKPSGLYRATAQVRGAELRGGWIVLQDGSQVGIVSRDGKPAAAPPIDTATGAVVVDGTPMTARPVVP